MDREGNTTRIRQVALNLTVAAFVLVTFMSQNARAEMIDGIVAVVDDTVIMYSDVIRKMGELGAQEYDLATTRQVLQIMIEDAVVDKVYKRLGLQPVDIRRAEQTAREMNIDVGSARSMIMKSTLMEIMVKSRVVITDAMIQGYYDSRQDYAGTESFHLRQILVRGDPDRARRAMEELASGKRFEDVAASHSDLLVDGSPDIGWVAVKDMAKEVRDALESAKKGDIAGPVQAGEAILIFEVVEQGSSGGRPLEEVRDEIIEALQEKYRKEAFDHWLSMIMADHYIGIYL
ncbi:MAG TPA: peptidyl-prolyl cis-trans isomerase [Deltaproteobacteria bacterium]|nr:peptidyl-prolyl cis-trans isomerase [Deltaproteobacteria bacterium]